MDSVEKKQIENIAWQLATWLQDQEQSLYETVREAYEAIVGTIPFFMDVYERELGVDVFSLLVLLDNMSGGRVSYTLLLDGKESCALMHDLWHPFVRLMEKEANEKN